MVSSRDVVLAAWRRWWLVALCVVIGGVAGGGVHAAIAPVYSTTTSVLVAGSVPSGSSAFQTSTLQQNRVKSLIPVPSSTPVTQAVVQDLRLPFPARTLSSRISVSVPPETAVMDITVMDTDPTRSVAVAQAVVQEFSKLISNVDASGSRFGVSVVQPALVPATPIGLSLRTSILIGLLGGLVVGLAAAVVLTRRDDRLFSAVELSRSVAPARTLALRKATRREADRAYWHSHEVTEAFRRLVYLTTARWANSVGADSRRVLVTTDIGGPDASAVAWQLARTMASEGVQVVLLGWSDVDAATEPSRGSAMTFSALASGLVSAPELVGTATRRDGIVVVPHGPPSAGPRTSRDEVPRALSRLSDMCDVVVIDAPALETSADALQLARHVDDTVVVAQLARSRRQSLRSTIDLVVASGGNVSSVVAVPPRRRHRDPGRSAPDRTARTAGHEVERPTHADWVSDER